MPARNNSGKVARSLLIFLLVGVVVFAAMGAAQYIVLHGMPHAAPVASDEPSTRPDSVSVPKGPAERTDVLPKENGSADFSVPEVHGTDVSLVSTSDKPALGEEPAVFLANESLKSVHADSAKALSVQVKDRVAFVDFNSAIEDGFGSMQESSFIKALQVSLGQLPDVDKFQITVGGQPIESLGHFEVTDPIDVIRPTIKP